MSCYLWWISNTGIVYGIKIDFCRLLNEVRYRRSRNSTQKPALKNIFLGGLRNM